MAFTSFLFEFLRLDSRARTRRRGILVYAHTARKEVAAPKPPFACAPWPDRAPRRKALYPICAASTASRTTRTARSRRRTSLLIFTLEACRSSSARAPGARQPRRAPASGGKSLPSPSIPPPYADVEAHQPPRPCTAKLAVHPPRPGRRPEPIWPVAINLIAVVIYGGLPF